jgi:hypothetical protein
MGRVGRQSHTLLAALEMLSAGTMCLTDGILLPIFRLADRP